jgi:hypothetical protein
MSSSAIARRIRSPALLALWRLPQLDAIAFRILNPAELPEFGLVDLVVDRAAFRPQCREERVKVVHRKLTMKLAVLGANEDVSSLTGVQSVVPVPVGLSSVTHRKLTPPHSSTDNRRVLVNACLHSGIEIPSMLSVERTFLKQRKEAHPWQSTRHSRP